MYQVIVKNSTYNYDELKTNIYDMLTAIEAASSTKISAGKRVLIKPNILTAAHPDKAITTHPMIIKAVVEFVLDKGAHPQVSDSPAPLTKFSKIVEDCGIAGALKGLPVDIKEFTVSKKVLTTRDGSAFTPDLSYNTLELAEDALNADIIINLPKLKTHSQMGLTLAVKNLFGCVVGARKPQWHFKLGENKELFAGLLLTIHNTLRPEINILDGILSMEGNGPGSSGLPRPLGLLMGSANAVAIDMAVCQMLGGHSLLTNKAAEAMGDSCGFTISGEMNKVENFKFPTPMTLLFGLPFAKTLFRNNLTSRPKNIEGACKLCNECVKICPAQAIENDTKRLYFDYDKCIRCYCCLEVCPHQAIEVYQPMAVKAIKKFAKVFSSK
ncbi:MAG: DUF362 domain-containing protein [Candidatus Magnetominusculus sp. LBB02]|nr:DUF362 domain-containing protein [Candidatus Magnetominusculus sp. LBB02]